MTRKTIWSLQSQWSLHDVRRYPAFTFPLLSHKYLGFGLPLYLIGTLISLLVLFPVLGVSPASVVVILTLVAKGRITGLIRSFILADVGFFLGLWDALTEHQEGRYFPTRQI